MLLLLLAVRLCSLSGLRTEHPRLSAGTLNEDCVAKLSDNGFKHNSFRLAREEIHWNSTVKKSDRLLEYFFNPPWGADLYRISGVPIAYALAYKCNSEGISKSLLLQDQYHKAHPEEPSGFEVRRSVSPYQLMQRANKYYSTRNVTIFTFLRNPLAHFVSGLVEAHFLRLGLGNHPKGVNSSKIQRLFAQRSANVQEVKTILEAIFNFDKDVIDKKLLHYSHYSVQSGIIKKWNIRFVGRIENFAADWDHLNAFLGMNISRLQDSNHITSSDPLNLRQSLMQLFDSDPRYLRAVCRIVIIDFICLGYTLPDACADMI